MIDELIFQYGMAMTILVLSVFSSLTLGFNTIVFLKLISYAMTNSWCREEYKKQHKPFKRGRNRYKSYASGKICILKSVKKIAWSPLFLQV